MQRVVVERRVAPEGLEDIDVEITIEDLRPEATNSNPANRRRAGKKHSVHVDPGSQRPPEILAKDMTVFGFLLAHELCEHLRARADSTFAELPRLLSGRCDCAQQRTDAMMMQRAVMNLGLMVQGIFPMEFTGVHPTTATESMARSLVRILLLLQTEPTTPRQHCLLGCWNPPVRAPSVCELAERLGVQVTRNGVRTAAVSILPPLRDFDPPM